MADYLDDTTLIELIDMERESAEVECQLGVQITPSLDETVNAFSEALDKTLLEWAKLHRSDLRGGDVEGLPQPEDWVYHLMNNAEATYNVFMTLRGEGMGIWDGRWDKFFSSESALQSLSRKLKKNLGSWADSTGGGKLNDALRDAVDECAKRTEED